MSAKFACDRARRIAGVVPARCEQRQSLQRRVAKRPLHSRRMPLRIAPLLLSDAVLFRGRRPGSQRVCLSACGPAGYTDAGCSQAGEERRIPAQHCIPPQFLLQRLVEESPMPRGDGACLRHQITAHSTECTEGSRKRVRVCCAAWSGATAGNAWPSGRIRECLSTKPPTRRPESCRPTRVLRLPASRGCTAA